MAEVNFENALFGQIFGLDHFARILFSMWRGPIFCGNDLIFFQMIYILSILYDGMLSPTFRPGTAKIRGGGGGKFTPPHTK